MQFSVIYSVDVPQDENIDSYAPPNIDQLWNQTEGDDQYEYDHLEGAWENGSHRKWGAILAREEFDEFVEHFRMCAEDTETMGSIGAPGCGYGWAPAISFTSDDRNAIQSAYVTPLVRANCDERDWNRVKAAVLALY